MPGSVRHNNSMHGRLRARRAVVLVNLLQRRALARNAGAVMRTLAGLEEKEMDFETTRIRARWAAGAHRYWLSPSRVHRCFSCTPPSPSQ